MDTVQNGYSVTIHFNQMIRFSLHQQLHDPRLTTMWYCSKIHDSQWMLVLPDNSKTCWRNVDRKHDCGK